MPPVNAMRRTSPNRLTRPCAGGAQRVSHQHRDGQRANATGNRRQCAGDLGDLRMHVADEHRPFRSEQRQSRVTFVKQLPGDRCVGHLVHSDINDRGARFDKLCGDESGFPHSGDENIRAAAHLGQVWRA